MAPIQFLINMCSISLASFVIYYSKEGNLKSELQSLFSSKKLTTSELQADHLADITYYYAIFVLSISLLVTIVRFLKGQFNQAIHADSKFIASLNQMIVKSTEHLLIFMSIYVYLLQQKGFGLKVNSLMLMPFWFLLGRIAALIELLLTQILKNKFVFSYAGFTLTVFPYIVMIGQIFGYSPLHLF